MRDRYQKEQDLPLAERWLENYLLTRKQADSRQLLHTDVYKRQGRFPAIPERWKRR